MQPTIIIRYFLNVMVIALALKGEGVHPFQLKRSQLSCPQGFRSVALYGKKSSSSDDIRRKNQKDDDEYLFGSDQDYVKQFTSDDEILSSLNRKVKELELGIGKRYIIRTQRGFLNVHHEVRITFGILCDRQQQRCSKVIHIFQTII